MKLTGDQRERLARHLEEAVRRWALMETGYEAATETAHRLHPVPHAVIAGWLYQGDTQGRGEFVIEIRDELASLRPA